MSKKNMICIYPKPLHVSTDGYQDVFLPDHPMAMSNGYVYYHRLVMAEFLGRMLLPSEEVHHIDENKFNNLPSNLEILTTQEHGAKHGKRTDLQKVGEDNPIIECACGCRSRFSKYDDDGRPRKYKSGHNDARSRNG